jgi:hypothetical protein
LTTSPHHLLKAFCLPQQAKQATFPSFLARDPAKRLSASLQLNKDSNFKALLVSSLLQHDYLFLPKMMVIRTVGCRILFVRLHVVLNLQSTIFLEYQGILLIVLVRAGMIEPYFPG